MSNKTKRFSVNRFAVTIDVQVAILNNCAPVDYQKNNRKNYRIKYRLGNERLVTVKKCFGNPVDLLNAELKNYLESSKKMLYPSVTIEVMHQEELKVSAAVKTVTREVKTLPAPLQAK